MKNQNNNKKVNQERKEGFLHEINKLFNPLNSKLIDDKIIEDLPLLFIVGNPRSGTTVLLQWLAATGHFAYPTNLLSRFYEAPLVGAKIQQLLTDPEFDFDDQLSDLSVNLNLESSLGKTKGALQANEFWYFWRRFFPISTPQPLSKKQRNNTLRLEQFRNELLSLVNFNQKPFVMKGLLLNYDIDILASLFPKAIFIFLRRDPIMNMQSLLKARFTYYNDISKWYSARPKEYKWLLNKPILQQVAGQVFYTNRAIESSLNKLDSSRYINIDYEQFCDDSDDLWNQLRLRVPALPTKIKVPLELTKTTQWTMVNISLKEAISAYQMTENS